MLWRRRSLLASYKFAVGTGDRGGSEIFTSVRRPAGGVGDLAQCAIADGMPIAIVDLLEPVETEGDHRIIGPQPRASR